MDRDIEFSHVSFRYREDAPEVLHDVSMKIRAGSTVGILGATGAGKSTLMLLLDRMWELPPEQGKICVGGVDIRNIDRGWLRRNIGMVLQEPYLFSRTLEENLAIAMPDDQDPANTDFVAVEEKALRRAREIRRAAQTACLDEAVERFADGYETFVGERGVTLSGGQKQRAAIAQMLVRRTPVMIFDDSLSAVDAETDARIRRALQENTSEATVILIAHRITTLRHADEIFVLENGRIAEHGNHDELMSMGGIYSRVYELQTGAGE
jgi:ATP-binding cassette subfamily B protein